jgi:Immunity protein 8
MITPVLNGIGWDSPDDLSAVVLEEGNEFSAEITMKIGPQPDGEGDLFYVTVVSPEGLSKMAASGPRFLRHTLLVQYFDLSLVSDQVERLCSRCAGSDWHTAATKLSRYLRWEFEDYVA